MKEPISQPPQPRASARAKEPPNPVASEVGAEPKELNPLPAEAVAYLNERGITMETVRQHQIELHDQSLENRILPATYRFRLGEKMDKWFNGAFHEIVKASIWFPCKDANGTVINWIVRPFPPLSSEDGNGEIKFLSTKGECGAFPFIPPETWAVREKLNVPLLFTESPVKALATLQAGAFPLGFNGVWLATTRDDIGTILRPVLLEHFSFTGRTVYIAFDADFTTNPRVRQALIRTAVLLYKVGAEVKILTWPLKEGKGLDDYLVEASDSSQSATKVLEALYKEAGTLADVLHPADLDFFEIEAGRARLKETRLAQLCRLVAPSLKVSAEVLRAGIKNESEEHIPDYIKDIRVQHGEPFFTNGGPGKLNDRFWARLYLHENELIYWKEAKEFYRYDSQTGLFYPFSKAKLTESLCQQVCSAALSYGGSWLPLQRLCNTENVRGVISILSGIAEVTNPFKSATPVIVCTNQLIRFDEHTYEVLFEPFDPNWRKLHGSPFAYNPKANSERFCNAMLGHVHADDRLVLQKYAGQCLIGRNLTQRLAILDGIGGASKTEFIQTIIGVVGPEGCAELRTEQLESRFEIANISHASLLYGPDVKGNFLNLPGAHRIKSLVGGELLDCEFKGSNFRGKIEGVLNILISSNARLRLYIDSDRSAWERRLIVVRYDFPFNGTKIPEIHKMLLREKGSGILNWCIEGAKLLLADIHRFGDIQLSEKQKDLIQKMLNESDSLRLFLKACVVQTSEEEADLSTDELIEGYTKHCQLQGWDNLPSSVIARRLPDHMMEIFKVLPSGNILRLGRRCRGYRQIRWRTDKDDQDEPE